MASELAAYYVSIVPSAKGLTGKIAKEFSGIDREAEASGKRSGSRFSGAFKAGLAGIAGAFAAAGVGSFLSDSVTGAGKLEQSVGAISSVFKGSAKEMQAWSKTAAKDVGLSQNEFNELGTIIGAQLKNGGTAMDQLAPKTKNLIGMGADLSSMFGGTTKEAIEAMSSALRGETDPIERYGVSLSAARVEAKALAMGAKKVGGEFSQQAKQSAILALITEQTADAQGNFARESDTFAQKQQVMSAKWEDLKVKIGEQFMPALTKAFGYISDTVIPAVGNFRDGLAAVGQWVKDNAAWLAPLTTAVAGYALAMAGLSIVSSVRGWLAAAAAAQWGLNLAMSANPIGLIVAAVAGLVAGLVWFFTQTELGKEIWANVWAGIQAAMKVVVDWFNTTAKPIIEEVFRVIGEVFRWLYENVIKPAWEGIQIAVKAVVDWFMNTALPFIQDAVRNIGAVFQWLYDFVIKPVFNLIAGVIRFWWNNIVMPIFNAVSDFMKNVLGPAFSWLYDNVIKPVWERIQTIIKNVWEQDIKPVFDKLAEVITKTIPDAFSKGVEFIKTAWEKIQDVMKAPVKWAIDFVLNKGLIGAYNDIAGFLQIDKIPPINLDGWRNGGYTGNKPKGAVAGVVHGDEHVIRSESRRLFERSNPGLLDHINRTGSLSGYADGGRVAPLKELMVTQGYNRVHKGIDYAAGVGTPVFATQHGVVSHAGPGARAPGVWGGNEVHVAGGGLETWFAHLSQIGVALGQRVRAGQQIGLSGNTGISSGPHLHFGVFQGGWPNDMDPTAYLGGAGVPSGGSGGGWNPLTGIIDGLVGKFKDAFPQGGAFIDMVGSIGKKILTSAADFITGLFGGSDRKGSATATVYDGGGWLENTGGAQLVQHNKRKPDAVLSSSQWDTMQRIADNSRGAGVTFTGPIHVRDENELASIISTRQRDAQAAYGF